VAPSERARGLHPILGHKLPISLTKSIRVDLRLSVDEIIQMINIVITKANLFDLGDMFWTWIYLTGDTRESEAYKYHLLVGTQ
jgi:hypothetical protein